MTLVKIWFYDNSDRHIKTYDSDVLYLAQLEENGVPIDLVFSPNFKDVSQHYGDYPVSFEIPKTLPGEFSRIEEYKKFDFLNPVKCSKTFEAN